MPRSTSSRSALAIAVVALVVAIAGTVSTHPALAAKVLTKARVVRIANHQITKRSGTLTVNNANKLGARPASSYPVVTDFSAASRFAASCDPNSAVYLDCAVLQINLARPSKLLLYAEMPFGDDSNDGATGTCRLLLDAALLPQTTIRAGIGGTTGASSDNDNTGIGVTNVAGPVASGIHILTLQCNQLTADIDFNDLSMSALAVPV